MIELKNRINVLIKLVNCIEIISRRIGSDFTGNKQGSSAGNSPIIILNISVQ